MLAPNCKDADPGIQLARKLPARLLKALPQNRNRNILDDVIGRPEHQSAFKVLERVVSDDPDTVKLWNASGVITKEKLDDALKSKQTPLKLPMYLLPLFISSQRHLGT